MFKNCTSWFRAHLFWSTHFFCNILKSCRSDQSDRSFIMIHVYTSCSLLIWFQVGLEPTVLTKGLDFLRSDIHGPSGGGAATSHSIWNSGVLLNSIPCFISIQIPISASMNFLAALERWKAKCLHRYELYVMSCRDHIVQYTGLS